MPLRPVRPMMATPAAALPEGPGWSYEVKWDGYRTLAIKDGTRVTLVSRNLKNATSQYPAIVAAISRIRAGSLMLDGEIVALDEQGRPSFQALQHRAAPGIRLAYYAFDLLHVDGRSLLTRPLDDRRAALARLDLTPPIFLSEPLPGTPAQIARVVRRLKLEGVVAKRRDSMYQPGKRSPAWLKVKFLNRQEFAIGGYRPSGANFDSILAGYYDDDGLRYAGKVRAGFTPPSRAALFERLVPLEVARCPFVDLPSSRTSWGEGVTAEDMRHLKWVDPRIVVEVTFVEWTKDGALRHAAFAGLREDKPARQVRRDAFAVRPARR